MSIDLPFQNSHALSAIILHQPLDSVRAHESSQCSFSSSFLWLLLDSSLI